MAETKLKPELRFPEFSENWGVKKMGEIFNSIRQKGNKSLPIFSVSQKHGLIERELLDRNIQKDAASENNLVVESGDIVYNMMRMWQGAIGLAKSNSMVSPAYVVLRTKKSENSTFYLFLFEKKRSLYLFRAYSYGLTDDRLRLYFKDFTDIKCYSTIYDEQQKIASFLSSVDQRIQLLQKKKAKLDEYKKGIMQKLFSQEIRFKDDNGNDFPDWEEKKLHNIATITKGKQLNKSELTENGEYPCQNGGIEPSGYTNKYNMDANTITISEGGNSCGYVNYMKVNFWCGGHCYSLINIREFINDKYLFQFLKFKEVHIMRLRVGSGLPNIQRRDLISFKVQVPLFIEQQKIASFLTAMDQSIEGLDKEIEASKTFKKGLLQKMFI